MYLSPFPPLCTICVNQLTTVVVIIWGNTTITTRTCTYVNTATWHNTCGGSISNSESAPVRVHSGRRSVLGQSEAKNTRDKYSFKRIPRASIVLKYFFNSRPLCPCWGITSAPTTRQGRVSRDKQCVRCKDNNLSRALCLTASLTRWQACLGIMQQKFFTLVWCPATFASCSILLLSSCFQRVVLWKV